MAAEYADLLLLGAARDVHHSVAGRVHAVTDRVGGRLPGQAHRLIAGSIYGAIGLGLRSAAAGLRAADERGLGPAIDETAPGRFAVAAVNGLIGDTLTERGSALAVRAAVRHRGRDLPLDRASLAHAFPEATGSVVVFLHGLCESEEVWNRRSRPARPDRSSAPSYGDRLAADLGWTPVYLRTNTGHTVAESGVAVAALLERLREHWPVEVTRIALIGHSMGGLVARAACSVADVGTGSAGWQHVVTDLVTLGTPHIGSPVERGIARGVRHGSRVAELAPFARIFEQRSAGVLDLHHGRPDEDPQLPGLRYRFVAATLTRSPGHPVAKTIGDTLVPYASALGQRAPGSPILPRISTLHVPRADHFDLLNHDDVHRQLALWLA